MQVAGDEKYPEELRLKYRFLDLRREKLHATSCCAPRSSPRIRRRMIEPGFTEFQTPILTASSPEGARDFLVPARLHPGKFYALPQAPQQFKQLLMVAGFDRYFQIAPCFRDEDSRADRSPGEFYQLDFEMSFVTQEDVFATIEPVIAGVFEEFADGRGGDQAALPAHPLRRGDAEIRLRQAGSAQPAAHHRRDRAFRRLAASACSPRSPQPAASCAPSRRRAPAANPRSFFDKLNDWARAEGAAASATSSSRPTARKGPIAKNLEPERAEAIRAACGLKPGDAVFFVAGKHGRGAEIRRRRCAPSSARNSA